MTFAEIKAKITVGIADFEANMKKVGKHLEDVGGKLDKAGEKVKTVGSNLTTSLSLPITAMGTLATKEFGNFETALAKVSTIADANAISMGDMEQSITDASDKIGVASKDVAEAVYQAISAGVDTADAVSFVVDANKLAVAGFTDTTKATDILTTVMNAYGMEADKVSKVSDVLMLTQNKGKTTVDQLASSLGKAIPIANANAVSFENIGSSMAVATAKGINTAEATTMLSAMLKELGTSSTDVAKALKEKTGQSFKDLMESGMSLSDVLGIVGGIADDSGLALNEMFGSSEAGTMALTLMADGGEAFTDVLGEMNEAVGVTDDGFAKMEDTMENKLQKAFTSMQNSMIEIGAVVAPIVADIAIKVSELAQSFTGLPDEVQKGIVIFGALLAVLPPIILTVGTLMTATSKLITTVGKIPTAYSKAVTGISKFTKAVKGLPTTIAGVGTKVKGLGATMMTLGKSVVPVVSGALSGLSSVLATVGTAMLTLLANPVTWIILGIVALAVAIYMIIKHWDVVKEYIIKFGEAIYNATSQAWESIKGAVSSAVEAVVGWVTEKWEAIKTTTSTIWETIKGFITGVWESIKGAVVTVATAIYAFVLGIWTAIYKYIAPIVELIRAVVVFAWQAIQMAIAIILTIIMTIIKVAWETIKFIVETVLNVIVGVVTTVWETIKTVIQTVLEIIVGIVTTVWEFIKTVTTNVFNAIKDFILPIWESIKTAISNTVDRIKTAVSNTWNTIKTTTETIFNAVKNFILPIWESIKTTVSGVVDRIKTAISNAWNTVKTTTETIFNAVKNFILPIWENIKTAVSNTVNAIKSAVKGAWDGIKSTTSTIFNSLKSTIMGIWNGIGSGIQGVINGIINAINSMIGAMNGLSFDVPEWVPVMGGKKFGFNIPKISNVSWFETGGIFTGASVIGVGENGDEAVVPLSNKTRMKPFAQAVASMIEDKDRGGDVSTGGATININSLVVREEADVRRIAEELHKLQERNRRKRGVVYV